MAAPSPPSTAAERPAWRVLLPLCLMVFAVLVHGSAIGPLAAEMARDLGTPIPLIGQVRARQRITAPIQVPRGAMV